MPYNFNENTPPRDIVLGACQDIAVALKNYKLLKREKEINRKSGDFLFSISILSDGYNKMERRIRISINCSISNHKYDEGYYGHNLGYISNDNFMDWDLYGLANYKEAVTDIISRFKSYFLPLTERFLNDMDNLVTDVVEKGFYPDNEKIGYSITPAFLLRYGNKELLQCAAQKYYNSLYPQAKDNFKKTTIRLKDGIEPERSYAFNSLANTLVKEEIDIIY